MLAAAFLTFNQVGEGSSPSDPTAVDGSTTALRGRHARDVSSVASAPASLRLRGGLSLRQLRAKPCLELKLEEIRWRTNRRMPGPVAQW